MNTVKDYIKNNIPEFQENSPSLQAYLDVMGDFLDALNEKIKVFDHIKDYEIIDFGGLNQRLRERGSNLPKALPIDFKRFWLRDVADHKAKIGTRAAIQHAFSSIGINVDYSGAWILSPELIQEGKYRHPKTHEVEYYPNDGSLQGSFLKNLVFGEAVPTTEGVFLHGNEYTEMGDVPPKVYHIYGERYKTPINTTAQFVAAKTPYLLLKFQREDFNINTGKYIDPVTGNQYAYTDIEEHVLMDEIIQFFSLGENRPTTVKIILAIVDKLYDEVSITEELEERGFFSLSRVYGVHSEDIPVFTGDLKTIVGGQWEVEEMEVSEGREVVTHYTPHFPSLLGKPSSSAYDIDLMTDNGHSHTIDTDDISEHSGNLIYKGNSVGTFWDTVEW